MFAIYNYILSLVNYVALKWKRVNWLFPFKVRRFLLAQRDIHLLSHRGLSQDTNLRPVLWFHASSYGEYNIARPLIEIFHKSGQWRIILSIFSPSGYDELKLRHDNIDEVLLLPLDTASNAQNFIQRMRPSKAVFIVAEFWVNYLTELKRRKIPTFLISAHITGKEPFFKWYGAPFRQALGAFTHIFVLDEHSVKRLAQIGITRASVASDPLFDTVLEKAATAYHNEIIENFVSNEPIFIAGSVHQDKDIQLVTSLANHYPEIRFIIVPHEISEEILFDIMRRLDGHSRLYSECSSNTDFATTQTLIIDFMGALSYLYRYAQWAYVGGGFTPYLHNVLEATVYGIPVAFGPCIERKPVASDLIDRHIGISVQSPRDLDRWFNSLRNNHQEAQRTKSQALEYVEQYRGGAGDVYKTILGMQSD